MANPFFIYEPKETILDSIPNGTSLKKTIIPVFEITYMSTGFGVYTVEDEAGSEFIIKGTFATPLIEGQTYSVSGKVIEYREEKQLSVDKIRNTKPTSKRGIVAYLQTLKGLKSKADLIYDSFGMESINILINDPMRVSKLVHGIGKKSVASWQEQLIKMQDIQDALISLLDYGLTQREAKKLYEKYGEEIIEKLESNPYVLAVEVKGYGFEKCDRIARQMGYNPKSEYRVKEAIMHTLECAANQGHCYLPGPELVNKTLELVKIRLTFPEMIALTKQSGSKVSYKMGELSFELSADAVKKSLTSQSRYLLVDFEDADITSQIEQLIIENRVILIDGNIYLKPYYFAELSVAKHVHRIIDGAVSFLRPAKEYLDTIVKTRGIHLEQKQEEAIVEFTTTQGGFYILNGSAGSGKTFSLNLLLEIYEKQFVEANGRLPEVVILAPTGKASKVASAATKRPAKTVHRGLAYNPMEGFTHNEVDKIPADVIVLDESSMLDILLADALLIAIATGTTVVFLGDTKQLPSVGAGNVLHDLIESGIVKIITLNVIKRQGKDSGIVGNANLIIENKMILSEVPTNDAYVIQRETPKATLEGIIQSIERIIKTKSYAIEDIQVLCPQKGTMVGTEYVNYTLQSKLNPHTGDDKILNKKIRIKLEPTDRDTVEIELYFRPGDKVIHVKNNYEMPWYQKTSVGFIAMGPDFTGITNGECGVIESIQRAKNALGEMATQVTVKYEEGYILYSEGVSELEHAYALTIHKSQGSQWKAVIIPMMMINYTMLDSNLFYTAYTRAESFIVVVGQKEAIRQAIITNRTRKRYTSLDKRLVEAA